MRRMLCALIGVLCVSSAWAEPQFWIVIGSYQDSDNAEQTMRKANVSMDESFAVSSIDIQAGRWYRVASGPYLTSTMADLTLIQARQAGFDGAWTLVTESDQDLENDYGTYDAYTDGSDYNLPDYDDALSDSAYEYPDIESLLPPAVSLDQEDNKTQSPPRELVVEVPDGYELHKLHREAD